MSNQASDRPAFKVLTFKRRRDEQEERIVSTFRRVYRVSPALAFTLEEMAQRLLRQYTASNNNSW